MYNIDIYKQYLESNLKRYLTILKQMVDINSFTANPEGVNKLGRLTSDIFAPLGFEAEFVQSENLNYGKHLFLFRRAKLRENILGRRSSRPGSSKSSPTVALISHLDTVFSQEEEKLNNFYWRREGERIYGPGTVDIKGGTVMIYIMVDTLMQKAPQIFDAVNWLVCLDATEEILAGDFGAQCLARCPADTIASLVFEGCAYAEGQTSLVVARKGRATFDVNVEGRSAHAGNSHDQGANALIQLAHTMLKIADFTDYEKQITFNVGTAQGGSVVNRVPHFAEAQVEMRAFSPEVFQWGHEQMLALNGASQVLSLDGYPCNVSIQPKDRTDPWPKNQGTDRLFNLWRSVGQQLGTSVFPEERGGLSDGNMLWDNLPTLDGLGPGGSNSHCSECSLDGSKDQEYVLESSFVPKALLNILAIQNLIENS